MQTPDYPLIFIVDNNSIYNRLIANHLRSKKFQRIESFFSGEECLRNLYKKPDIVIQDYLINEVNGNDIIRESKKSNPSAEFIFLSDLDSIDDAANTIKYGANNYLVKDSIFLRKLINKINLFRQIHQIRLQDKNYKFALILFFIALTLVIMSLVSLTVIFPKTFSF